MPSPTSSQRTRSDERSTGIAPAGLFVAYAQ
jgi:hypothetical protein